MKQRSHTHRTLTLAACLSVALGAAHAQPVPEGCVANGNPNGAVAGAVIGGLAGALLGNAVAGRRKAGGTIIGGVTGAAAGAAIGGSAGGAPCPQGYVYRAVPPPEEAALPVEGGDGFWDGAPPRIHERIVFLRRRVERLDRDGWLSPRESEGLFHRLSAIAHQEDGIRDHNGGELPPDARDQLTDELNDVARHLRWKEYRTQHAAE